LDTSRLLDQADLSKNEENLGPDQDLNFAGKIILGGRSYPVQLPEFNLFCNPSQMRIHVGEKHFDLTLYSVDMWTWTTRDDPGRDGTPKIYLAAIKIPELVLQTQDREIKKFVDHHFLKQNLEPDAFVIRASTNYFEMYARHSNDGPFLSCVRVGSSYATPDDARAGEKRMFNGFMAQANDRSLVIDNLDDLGEEAGHIEYLRQKIRLNAFTLKRLSSIMKVRRNHVRLQKSFAATIFVANVIAKITLITLIPKVRLLSRIAPALVHAYANSSRLLLDAAEQEHRAAGKVLLDRLAAYQSKLKS